MNEELSYHIKEYLDTNNLTLIKSFPVLWEGWECDDKWYFNWTMTSAQHESFKNYAIPLIKKIFKCNKSNAEKTFDWFNLGYGLRIKE
jgi:hypothetical protein